MGEGGGRREGRQSGFIRIILISLVTGQWIQQAELRTQASPLPRIVTNVVVLTYVAHLVDTTERCTPSDSV
jgi:hypothetical protein